MPRPKAKNYRPEQFETWANELCQLANQLRAQAKRVRDAGIDEIDVNNCVGMEEAPHKVSLFVVSIAKSLLARAKAEINANYADSKQHTVLRVAEEAAKPLKRSKSKK